MWLQEFEREVKLKIDFYWLVFIFVLIILLSAKVLFSRRIKFSMLFEIKNLKGV